MDFQNRECVPKRSTMIKEANETTKVTLNILSVY